MLDKKMRKNLRFNIIEKEEAGLGDVDGILIGMRDYIMKLIIIW